VRPCPVEIVPLVQDRRDADVHVGRAAQDDAFGARGEGQSALLDAHRLAETALRDPDVAERDRPADGVGKISALLQGRDPVRVGAVGGIQVTPRPLGESQQRRCRPSPQVIVLACRRQRLPGMSDGAVEIADQERLRRAIPRDGARQAVECG
jgi:hypothetical protein